MVSPAEPPWLRVIANAVNQMPENYGVDFLWHGQGGLWGVQRKQFPEDFLASRSDGRLAKEIQQMQALHTRFLLLEGHGTWLPNGFLCDSFAQYGVSQLTEFLLSLQVRPELDIRWLWVPAPEHTIEVLRYLIKWSVHHSPQTSLTRRPKPVWGTAQSRDWKRHFLMGLEDVGAVTADAILDHFEGELPFRLAVDEKRLRQVPGIGPIMAKRIAGLFQMQYQQEVPVSCDTPAPKKSRRKAGPKAEETPAPPDDPGTMELL